MIRFFQFSLSFLVGLNIFAYTLYANSDTKLGILFGSYGDVDGLNEIKGLVTSTVQDKDMVPLPRLGRFLLANLGWNLKQEEVKHEYLAIGGATGYRATSQVQGDLVAQQLRTHGYWAKGYKGFAFTFPFVHETLEQAQSDGVNRLIVMYQGAQHSRVTSHIIFRKVKEYMDQHPEWDVKVTAIRSFYKDPRWNDLLIKSIEERIANSFSDIPMEDICIFLPMHGNIMKWIEKGDPSYDQMMYNVNSLKAHFTKNPIYYGFQNHDEYPLLKWTQPKDEVALVSVAKDPCSKVIINGRISYTVDSLETLYDHRVAEKGFLMEKANEFGLEKEVEVEYMHNTDGEFISFMAELVMEALQGEGDLLEISEVDKVMPPLFDTYFN